MREKKKAAMPKWRVVAGNDKFLVLSTPRRPRRIFSGKAPREVICTGLVEKDGEDEYPVHVLLVRSMIPILYQFPTPPRQFMTSDAYRAHFNPQYSPLFHMGIRGEIPKSETPGSDMRNFTPEKPNRREFSEENMWRACLAQRKPNPAF